MKEVEGMSKDGKERNAELIDAYLRHIHEGGDIPDLSDLPEDERRELAATFKMLDAIAGVPADLVPDLEQDPVAKALGFIPSLDASVPALSPIEDVVVAEIESMGRGATILRDAEAAHIGELRSDLLLRVEGIRIRLVIVESIEEEAEDALHEADRVFYRFPHTSAVVFVQADQELLSQILEPRDCRPAIQTPEGFLVPPRARYPRLPLRSALTGYLEDVEPIWDPPDAAVGRTGDATSADEIAREVATSTIRRLSADGAKARTPAKQDTWIPLADREANGLARLILDIHSGSISISNLAARQQEIVEAAA
jgi:hypothetical protein